MFKLLKYEFYNMYRNKWIIFYFFFFLLITTVLFYFTKDSVKVCATLLNLTLLVIPLISLILGTIFLYDSRAFIELLLSQPINRRSIYVSKFIGIAFSLSFSFAVGVTFPILFFFREITIDYSLYLSVVTSGIMMTFIFLSIAFLIGTVFEDKVKGFGASILTWLYVTLVYDGIILFIIIYFQEYPLEKPVLFLSLINPVDLARIFVVLQLDISALLGYTGIIFKRFFETQLGMVVSLLSMLLWVIVPFLIGLKIFNKKDF
ncbi:MAG TPA: nitrous-oxide metabolic protein NosY [Persephonella sp.]|uniref:Nitrous-oxide metabolic protein NosY n=1 Tax=Persephonella marina (strain DSM 14350 / EX-H1) TaxID=123214 RepID=C0QQT9_PERMH|nr:MULTISPECIES: ABC transporter permease subunit [Persephonella]ACO04926.1 nitrous-oxide metabolic protein NosY [Persephonella marina EX-H1]HCB68785.1 nitrous-oxide metabolic protein NosY [Persephonella sp.]